MFLVEYEALYVQLHKNSLEAKTEVLLFQCVMPM